MSDETKRTIGTERPLWRNRDFVILRTGGAVSGLGSQMTRVALPLLTLVVTHSPALTGLIALASSAPALLFGLPLGAIVDRWNRRNVMAICALGLAAATGSIGIALLLSHITLLHLVLFGLASSILATGFGVAESASIPHVVPKGQLSAAVAQNEAVVRTTQLVGPALGGLLFGIARPLPFLADAVSFLAVAVAVVGLRTPLVPTSPSARKDLWREMGEGVAWVRQQPFVRTTLLLTAGSNVLLTAIYLLVIVVARRHGTPPAAIGLIFTIEALFAIGGVLLAPSLCRRLSVAQAVIGPHWLWVCLFPLYLISSNTVVLGVVTGAVFSLSPIRNVILISHQMRLIPNDLRGRVSSIAGLFTAGPMPLGSAVCGLLLQDAGTGVTIEALTAACLCLALVATFSTSLHATR